MNTNRIFHLLLAFVITFSLLMLPVPVSAQYVNCEFTVIVNERRVEVWSPLGTEFTMTIDDPSNGVGIDYTRTATVGEGNPNNPEQLLINIPEINIQPGFIVTVSAATCSHTLIVAPLAVTAADIDADTISGIATPGALRELFISPGPPLHPSGPIIVRYPVADSTGKWIVDFSKPGIPPEDTATVDLVPSSHGGVSEIDADGDITWLDLNVTWVPHIEARLAGNLIVASNWPVGTVLTQTIDNPTNGEGIDYTATATVVDNPNEGWDTWTIFWPDIDLKPGFIVTVTGGGISKTMVIEDVQLTSIDVANDQMTGITTPNREMWAWIDDQWENLIETRSDNLGNWTADFKGKVDLKAGSWSSISVFESDLDLTQANWQIFNGQILAPVEPVPLGQNISSTLLFNDPELGDTQTVIWDWGDGSTTTVPAAIPSVTTSHLYNAPGVYTIMATTRDRWGGWPSVAMYQFVVVFNPEGGFVTGGGWINSPTGAYTPDPSLTGKATFGFVSKYQKGATVPTGNTEFQFHIAGLNFKSTSYDWFVVAGSKAQYKGTGTINGMGEYKFLLTATDGSPDKFRIKIWDKTSGELIYDNQLGASDTAEPVTSIQGGSIVIQKVK